MSATSTTPFAATADDQRVLIIGGGPAGLTAAYLLSKNKIPVTLIEADAKYFGGISRTAQYKGFLFDIGGHRFFSKSKAVEDFWTEILPHDMLERPRSSRIYYRGKYFTYPLKAFEALFNLGIKEACVCVASYGLAKLFPVRDPKNFQDWVSNQFGKRLFSIFFKTYTEKVWGMDCREISSDWAAQRIKGLSLASAIWNALPRFKKNHPKADRSKMIKTLIDSFRYPRKGPGMMWDVCAEKSTAMGAQLHRGHRLKNLAFDHQTKRWILTTDAADQTGMNLHGTHVISSAPMTELVHSLGGAVPDTVKQAASMLRYRDFLTVMVILEDRELFTDNWIYIHDPSVKVGRIQNFKSWSPEMVPDSKLCCYGLEYFCFEGDGLWESSDAELLELAKKEIQAIGLAKASDILDGCVVRQKKAYPIYDAVYERSVQTISGFFKESMPHLHLVGRNGMHKYNNQDHAMMTAMLTVKNIIAGENLFDVWAVNQDAEYHESGTVGGGRMVPRRVVSSAGLPADRNDQEPTRFLNS